jgi:replicative DNA helicase
MVDSSKVGKGEIDDDEWSKLATAAGELSDSSGIIIDDTPGITVAEIRAKCRKLKIEKDIGLVVIDYLQLITGSGKTNSREQEIAEISRSLKILAKELAIPVIALSQLSRAPEARPDHRPMLQDLRESGSIEQDADVVMFIYRDDYYNQESEKPNIAEIIISKNRSGPLGTTELLWMPQYTKFANKYNGD